MTTTSRATCKLLIQKSCLLVAPGTDCPKSTHFSKVKKVSRSALQRFNSTDVDYRLRSKVIVQNTDTLFDGRNLCWMKEELVAVMATLLALGVRVRYEENMLLESNLGVVIMEF